MLDRGYTGHEHLLSVGLIHMNGRLYDPVLHRFLQPDNYVQDPFNTQNFNRYGYCLNNSLVYVDEKGRIVRFNNRTNTSFHYSKEKKINLWTGKRIVTEEEMVVRHHTSLEGLSSIGKSQYITSSRVSEKILVPSPSPTQPDYFRVRTGLDNKFIIKPTYKPQYYYNIKF